MLISTTRGKSSIVAAAVILCVAFIFIAINHCDLKKNKVKNLRHIDWIPLSADVTRDIKGMCQCIFILYRLQMHELQFHYLLKYA